jgi:DNA modification methylase
MVFDNINFTDEFGNEQKLEFNNFYCVDCMEVLKLMPDKSIDLCIVDPPYGIGSMGIQP